MELLLEKKSDLIINSYECVHTGENNYHINSMGCTGPPGPVSIQREPSGLKAILFSINFKTFNQNNYIRLIDSIKKLAEADQIKVNVSTTWNTKKKIKTKDNFLDLEKVIMTQNEAITNKFVQLCNELEKLGCYTEEISQPDYITLPEKCFEWNDILVGIKVYKHI